ncbi:hypothetical protein [Pontibacter sp. SGAir0037]|uniref:hypothetical protein n=1 Tax=Pontibacter sp. SGAir0037 TaxID=2571030 RepID=UPI0010CCFBF8|nr:hypothetical protein [Pontibacter sp. SGAir0037]QCR22463.1 hypothetical protein C1N53_09025 [Pontibacter sp. SGAir0037]
MNRKYIVDTTTREYLCVALQKGKDWSPTNQDSLQRFMTSRSVKEFTDSELVSGEFNDNTFFEKWIRNGTNFLFRY